MSETFDNSNANGSQNTGSNPSPSPSSSAGGAGGAGGGTPSPSPSPSPAPAGSPPSPAPAPSPAPTPGPSPAPGKTILDGGGTGGDAVTPADWPADWRQKLAGDDKKLLGALERLGSPIDLAKKIREQDALITKITQEGGKLPKDATAEQIAAYRKQNNIPDTPDKYDLTLQDGLVIGEADKPIVNNMLTAMHGMNLNNDQVKQILASYYNQEKQFLVERDKDIATKKTEHDDALHAEWGNEYRPNLNAISALTKTFSEETRNSLAGALDSDGYPLLNNKAFLKDMAVMSRTINPIDTVVSSGGGNQMSSVEDEIKTIEGRMGGIDPTYYKDEKAQTRLLQLYEWRDKQKKVS